MARRKYTKEEIQEWYKEHPGALYFNRNDSNLFVPKRTFGFSPNFAHPVAVIIVIIVIGLLVTFVIFLKQIFR